MSDLISRSALIRTIKCRKDVHKVEYAHDKRESDFIRCCECSEIERLVNEQPTVEAKPVEWISVEDRLPEDDYDTVLCVQEDRYYFVAVYTKEHGFRTEDFYGDCDSIVAWKPIIPFDFADMRGEKHD